MEHEANMNNSQNGLKTEIRTHKNLSKRNALINFDVKLIPKVLKTTLQSETFGKTIQNVEKNKFYIK